MLLLFVCSFLFLFFSLVKIDGNVKGKNKQHSSGDRLLLEDRAPGPRFTLEKSLYLMKDANFRCITMTNGFNTNTVRAKNKPVLHRST